MFTDIHITRIECIYCIAIDVRKIYCKENHIMHFTVIRTIGGGAVNHQGTNHRGPNHLHSQLALTKWIHCYVLAICCWQTHHLMLFEVTDQQYV